MARLLKGKGKSGERGFTLIEILVVIAVLGILAAVVIPNVTGFLTRGKDQAYKADQRLLQSAVDAWRTDVTTRTGNKYPVLDLNKSNIGTPDPGGTAGYVTNGSDATEVNSFIDIAALSTGNYLKGNDVVKSADTTKNTSATNSPAGSYGWYIDTGGVVKSNPAFTAGTYP